MCLTAAFAEFVFERKSDFVAHAFTPLGMRKTTGLARSFGFDCFGTGSLKIAPHLEHFQFLARDLRYIWQCPQVGQLGIIFSLNSRKEFCRSFASLVETISELELSVDVFLIVSVHSLV